MWLALSYFFENLQLKINFQICKLLSVFHFQEEVDAGGIIVQESVSVFPNDTVETLQERVKTLEHRAFPKAMELFASGKVRLDENGKVKWL